jgi:hypothetical protein
MLFSYTRALTCASQPQASIRPKFAWTEPGKPKLVGMATLNSAPSSLRQ